MPALVRTISALGLAAVLGAPALGDTPAEVLKLVDDLKSPKLATREDAMTELSVRGEVDLAMLTNLLKRQDLTPEQRLRLETAAKERFMRSPRGALGVQFRQGVSQLVIETTMERFPASKVLKPGDLITAIDGVAMLSRDAFDRPSARPYIISRDPGDVIKVTVRRGAETVTLDCPLGRFTDLGNNRMMVNFPGQFPGSGGLMPSELEEAWQVRVAALQPGAALQPVETGLSRREWMPGDRALVEREAERREVSPKGPPTVVAGGHPRFLPGIDELAAGAERMKPRMDLMGPRAGDARIAAMERDLQVRIAAVSQEYTVLKIRLQDNALTAEARAEAEKALNARSEELTKLYQRLSQLNQIRR